MEIAIFLFQLLNIVSILIALIILLISTRRYEGMIGQALTYLSVGIVISALVSVSDLLSRTVDFNTFTRLGNVSFEDMMHSAFVTFAFLMIAAGFYKLSKIYKRI